jgi:N,N'-diacetyllegionaminate synthase
MKTTIIAEAGVNHNGDLNLAKKMIEIAAQVGADFVKFKTFTAEKLVTRTVPKAAYQRENNGNEETQYEMLKKLELTEEMHQELIAYSKLCGIDLISTAFDITDSNLLYSLGQRIFKVPSGEITNLPYLRHLGKIADEIILSTGMSTLSDVENALNVLKNSGVKNKDITILHCTSAYPAPFEEVNLLAMQKMKEVFNVKVGYSDHTQGIVVSLSAVALGAVVIEKHFTLDKNLPGPDHKASLEPTELKELISSIRIIESALGSSKKKVTKSEFQNMELIRKSIVARSSIKKGDIFTDENLTTKRPGNGISPMNWDSLIGTPSNRDYRENDLIEQ